MKLNIFLPILFTVSACQAPKQPNSLKTKETSVNPTSKTSDVKPTPAPGVATFDAGGAPIGTDVLRAKVKTCLDAKFFYDRRADSCSSLPLANVGCTLEKLKLSMTESQYTSLTTYLNDPATLKGFLIDQCLDCPDPAANTLCKGTSSTPPEGPGMRIFLVKDSTSDIAIQTLFVKFVSNK